MQEPQALKKTSLGVYATVRKKDQDKITSVIALVYWLVLLSEFLLRRGSNTTLFLTGSLKAQGKFCGKILVSPATTQRQAVAPMNYKHGYGENRVKFLRVYFNK